MIPKELKYTNEHEWVRIEGDKATVGITDHAQSALGDITFIELPETGRKVKKSDSVATVESVKAASDIYAPLSGEIVEINEKLNDSPEVINSSPYADGWIYKIKIANNSEANSLLDEASYEKILKG